MRRLKEINFPLYEILLVALGSLLGVFFTQYEYFELDEKMSMSDLLIFVLTSVIGLYIANNIARSLSHIQSIKSLYQEDIKAFISHTKKLEDWIEQGQIPAQELRAYLKQGNVKLRFLQKLYGANKKLDTTTLTGIISKYNNFKSDITGLNTVYNGAEIHLLPAQVAHYATALEDIKCDLLNAIIHS